MCCVVLFFGASHEYTCRLILIFGSYHGCMCRAVLFFGASHEYTCRIMPISSGSCSFLASLKGIRVAFAYASIHTKLAGLRRGWQRMLARAHPPCTWRYFAPRTASLERRSGSPRLLRLACRHRRLYSEPGAESDAAAAACADVSRRVCLCLCMCVRLCMCVCFDFHVQPCAWLRVCVWICGVCINAWVCVPGAHMRVHEYTYAWCFP